ncbi:DUF4194 domain-containing protein [Pseudomonas aeruginosa]|uniref:DUF4194 domain-containing protein n=1 Tax=Pseudomonas aeruginosa TaxID=287 RepID=UPI000B127395|nr:DUF4194 domain-containing protein [Pseudomonas aeruginosa]
MNWSENDEAAMPAEAQAPDDAQAPANTLFLGDSGELALDTRRALVQLLAGPSLDGRRHPKLWPILVRDEAVIRRRLAELFLELVIDRDIQVADSTTLGHPARAHLDTRSTRTWTPDPRPLGQAVGAQRRRVALLV